MHTSAHLPHPTILGALRRLRALLVGLLAAAAGLVGVVMVPTTAQAASDTASVADSFDTQVLANDMYNQAFQNSDTGRGAALAMILFISVLPVMVFNIRRMQRES